MGLFGSVFSAAFKVVTTPLHVIEDVATMGDGSGSTTGKTLGSAVKDIGQGVEDIFNGDL